MSTFKYTISGKPVSETRARLYLQMHMEQQGYGDDSIEEIWDGRYTEEGRDMIMENSDQTLEVRA
jgi:hypothetical protein